PPPGTAATPAGTRARTPVVVDWWRDHPADAARRYRFLATGADGVTTPSRTTKTQVREHGADGDDVRVVPESVDFDLVESADVDDRFDAVYARHLDRHANVETFLLGLAELRGRDWTAAVVGDGPERGRIEAIASDLRIADRVSFLGDLPRRERVEIFKGTHVVAATATWETFATELLWALACGCVALVEYQADSSAHELVEGRERGRLVTSPAELADEFVAVGDLPRRTVEPDFSEYDHDPVLDRYVSTYRELVGE
ncbi:glycosyltransferase, partial [Halorubrum sp. Boch-26]|uniref:glycosyltransferase n=1 Tax=Halorubrum sp. Boch-26 TaxID=2994426 RepID=UPI0024693B7A